MKIIKKIGSAGAGNDSVEFYERFGRYAENTQIQSGQITENGQVMNLWNQAGFNSVVVKNGAIEPLSGDVFYIGGTVPSPNGKFSMTVVVELRKNLDYVSGVATPAVTFSFGPRPFVNLGDYLGTNPNGVVHIAMRDGVVVGPYTRRSTSTPTMDTQPPPHQIPVGVKFPIHISCDGKTLEFSYLGNTTVWRDPSVLPTLINSAGTGFFVEPSKQTTEWGFFAIHSIAVNAPSLETNLHRWAYADFARTVITRADSIIPSRLRLGDNVFATNQGPDGSEVLAFGGKAHLGYNPYFRPNSTNVAKIMGTVQSATSQILSVSNSSDAALSIFIPRFEQTGLAAGGSYRWKFYGRFGANSNTKRIKLRRMAAGAVRFDSGDLTENGTAWTLEFVEFRTSAGYKFFSTFKSATADLRTFNESPTGANNEMIVTGTAAGDVVVDYFTCELIMP